MKVAVTSSLCLILPLACSLVRADVFLCKDASGRTLTSDRRPLECVGEVREMGSSGQIVRIIAPPLTAEQKQQKKLEEEQRKAAQAEILEQKRQDRSLLARYTHAKDIEAARQRSLEQSHEQIKRETLMLNAAEKQLGLAKAEIAPYTAKKAAVPVLLKDRLSAAELAVQDSKKAIRDFEAAAEQINVKYDTTLARFREITGTGPGK